MATTTESRNVQRAQETATDEERQYISSPKKNYTTWIVVATLAIIAGAAWYFYKN